MSKLVFNEDGNLTFNSSDIPKNCIIVISKGVAKIQKLHDFGTLEVKTHQGNVKQIANTENIQF